MTGRVMGIPQVMMAVSRVMLQQVIKNVVIQLKAG